LITATPLAGSSIGRVERDILCDLSLPAVPVREQAFLVVVELLGCLGRELEVWSQDDGVDGAGLLAETAVDARFFTNHAVSANFDPDLGQSHRVSRVNPSDIHE
jgi:hypothetical protein